MHVTDDTQDSDLFRRQQADLRHARGRYGPDTCRNRARPGISQVLHVALPAALFGRELRAEGLGENPVRPRALARAGVVGDHPLGQGMRRARGRLGGADGLKCGHRGGGVGHVTSKSHTEPETSGCRAENGERHQLLSCNLFDKTVLIEMCNLVNRDSQDYVV